MIIRALLTLALCFGLAAPSWAAVSFGTTGAVTAGTTSVNVPYPASIAANDLLILCVGNKFPTNAPSTPSGWTAPTNGQGTADDGAGNSTEDAGPDYSTAFYKVADGTESGNLTVTCTSCNSFEGVILRYINATGQWLVAAVNGGEATKLNAFTATMSGDPGVTGGDMYVVCAAKNNNTGIFSSEAVTQVGMTFGTSTERAENSTSLGFNVGMVVSDHAVSSGTASAAPIYTATVSSTGAAGGVVLLRIREDNAAPTAIQSTSGFLGAIIQ